MPSKATAGVTTFRFDQMATLINDRVDNPSESGVERYVGLEHLDAASLRIRRWGQITDVESTKLRFQEGDIIFGKRRVYQRKLAVADFEGICSAHAMVLRAKAHVALPEFLPFFMQSDRFMGRALAISVGSLSPTINWTTLAAEQFALPPIEEQRRMARMLGAGRQVLDATHDLLHAAERVALAHAAAAAQRIASQYEARPLGEVADVRYGLTVNPLRNQSSRRAPYLRVANVARGVLNLAEVKEIGLLAGEADYELQSGDVLVVEGHADANEIGRAAVWRNEIVGAMHQNHLIRVRCGDPLQAEYLCALINSSHGRRYFRSRAKSSSGLNTINSTVVKQYAIPLPPKDVQTGLVNELRMLNGTTCHLESRQAAAKRLMTVALRFDDGADQ